jgi:hypothetical protein
MKIPESYFVDVNKLILKFIWKDKSPSIASTIMKKKAGGLALSDFQAYYKQESVVLVKELKWNRIKSPEIEPHEYAQEILGSGAKGIQWSRDGLFDKSSGSNRLSVYKKQSRKHSTQTLNLT